MRVLVFADSHGDSESIKNVMKRFYPDIAIHLGDGIDDFIPLEKDFPQSSFFHVKGDVDNTGEIERFETFENILVYITHRNWSENGTDKYLIVKKAMETDADIILNGHTHNPALFTQSGKTFMNPGSISKSFGFRTFGMIDIFEDNYICEILFADNYGL